MLQPSAISPQSYSGIQPCMLHCYWVLAYSHNNFPLFPLQSGENTFGQLGTGARTLPGTSPPAAPSPTTTTSAPAPAPTSAGTEGMLQLQQVLFGGESCKAVACGDAHSAAVTETGNLYCWGRADRGQCGTGDSPEAYATPQKVGFPAGVESSVMRVDCGAVRHNHALLYSGKLCARVLWCCWVAVSRA